ncbi:hypothetical protein [Plasmodium yoelii yoelii]|uniref:Uncharacterized protein n=1 Tax=Plasmodium yoelii yoelii TaxID=73239 RepID=Q7RCM8_PLAYO|nr:hypothetical protein [Plasmodium yoelii yoelii]
MVFIFLEGRQIEKSLIHLYLTSCLILLQNNESETSIESYKDVNEFLENSDESNSSYSSENENSDFYNSNSIGEKNNFLSFVSNNFRSKKEKKYKKCYTTSYINHMNRLEGNDSKTIVPKN